MNHRMEWSGGQGGARGSSRLAGTFSRLWLDGIPAMASKPLSLRRNRPMWRHVARWLLVLGLAALYATTHIGLGLKLAEQTNHEMAKSDQANNLKCARIAGERAEVGPGEGISRAVGEWMPHYTDGVVNPLWPRVAAGFGTGLDDEAFFQAGKRWNVWFTGFFLAGCGVWLGWRWSPGAAAVFLLASGLGAFLPRAPWFQPEPLYFALFFLSWWTGLALLKRNPVWLYAVFGVWTGLAYLAKGSVQPLLLVFAGVSTLRFLACFWPGRREVDGTEGRSPWNPSNHFIGMSVFLCVHLVVIAPRLSHAHAAFGSPFHAYPSHWMWMDDFEEGYAWMGKHNTREALLALRPEDKPSFSWWRARHEPAEGWRRLVDGTWWQARRFVASDATPRDKQGKPKRPWRAILEHPGWTLAALMLPAGLAAAFAVALRGREKLAVHRQEPERGMIILFFLGAIAFYTMLHGWYTPVGDGDRFMLALWAPVVAGLLGAGESIMRKLEARGAPPAMVWTYHVSLWLIAGWLGLRLLELWKLPVFA